jgi:hypothetical protein
MMREGKKKERNKIAKQQKKNHQRGKKEKEVKKPILVKKWFFEVGVLIELQEIVRTCGGTSFVEHQ